MSKYYISLIVILLFFSCNSIIYKAEMQNLDVVINQAHRIEQLKIAYNKKDYVAFFNLFPNTFSEFENTYGYDDTKETTLDAKMPLYDFYAEHISFYFNYEGKINEELFINKTFRISLNGYWNADNISYFQKELRNLVKEKIVVFLKILSSKSDEESTAFWHFVLEELIQNNKHIQRYYEELFNSVQPLDRRQAELIRKEFNRLLQEYEAKKDFY